MFRFLMFGFFVFLCGCEIGYTALIKPDDDLILFKNAAIRQDSGAEYMISAAGTNGCCLVRLDIKNPSERALTLRPMAAHLDSRCSPSYGMSHVVVRAPKGAKTFDDIDKIVSQTKDRDFETVIESPEKSVAIAKDDVVEMIFYAKERWQQKCVPYRFRLERNNGAPITITFFEIE